MAPHTSCNMTTSHTMPCAIHTCGHLFTPTNGMHTAPPVWPARPVCSPACPYTSTKHLTHMAPHTSCDMPTSHIPCRAPYIHVNTYSHPRMAHRQPPSNGPLPCIRPCIPLHTHQTSHAHGTTHLMQHDHESYHAVRHTYMWTPIHTHEWHAHSSPPMACPPCM